MKKTKGQIADEIGEVNEQRKKAKITGPDGEVVQKGETSGERRSASYAARVKQWWNSRLHGQFKKQDIEGARRVLCVITAASGATVTQAEGTRTKKRSAKGAARAAAIGKVCSSVKAAHGGKRVFVDLAELKFTYEVLEG